MSCLQCPPGCVACTGNERCWCDETSHNPAFTERQLEIAKNMISQGYRLVGPATASRPYLNGRSALELLRMCDPLTHERLMREANERAELLLLHTRSGSIRQQLSPAMVSAFKAAGGEAA